MAFIHIFLAFLLFDKFHFISTTVYSCNRAAECGCSANDAIVNKIVGGEAAIKGSWEWAVSLQANGQHYCGGIVVSSSHVVTAAHCIQNATVTLKSAVIVSGINSLSESTSSKATIRRIMRVISHHSYNKISKVNDIAVLRLDKPLHISNSTKTAQLCVPQTVSEVSSKNFPIVDSLLVAVGWGKVSSISSNISQSLPIQQVTLKSMAASDSMCRNIIRDHDVQFCAAVRGGDKDTCQGDSGGPLMYFERSKNQWVLAGITSYGSDCGNPAFAGVYTRVSVYQDWLQSIVDEDLKKITVSSSNSIVMDVNETASMLYFSFTILLHAYFRI